MPGEDRLPATVELAIMGLQRSVDLGFERTSGQLSLLIQRQDHAEQRASEHDTRIGAVETQLGELRRVAVTSEYLEARQASSARMVGIVVSIVAIVASSGVSILVAILT